MQSIVVKIEKTKEALQAEKDLNISWEPSTGYSCFDAGFDLRSTCKMDIKPFSAEIIPIGLHFELPTPNWEIQIRPRSGLAAKNGITILNSPGTIDYDYREEVKVILYNTSKNHFNVKIGDRIAQACIRAIPSIKFKSTVINKSKRKGFGSTGMK